jgi:DNA polymerase (family 10)
MTNQEIAALLSHVAAAYAITNEKKFRFQILAYEKAADSIKHSPTELKELYKEDKLGEVPGVGASLRSHLEELFRSGHVKHFDEVLRNIPEAVFPLLDIPSFGPKKAYRLVSEFQLQNPATVFEDIATLGKEGKIAKLAGFGEKSQADILRALEEFSLKKGKSSRMVLSYASELAKKLVAYLEQCEAVIAVSPLGSLRRRVSTIGDIDLAVSTHSPEKVLDYFVAYPHTERVIERGERTSSILLTSGKQIDLMTQPPESFGSLLQHFTGSKAHNVHLREYALSKGLSLSEYGIRKKDDPKGHLEKYASEEDFYRALDMQWIPPEMREDTGEIELALKGHVPHPVALSDIKGDFHIHSSFVIESSHDLGKNSMEEMLQNALKLGYRYLGFSEHNPSFSKHTSKQIASLLEKRSKYIEQLRLKFNKNIRIFSLLETDIQPNGKLALPEEAMEFLDATLVSIHSAFDMDPSEMTKRVLEGLSHPKAKILCHPTGRLLNQRRGYDLEWEKIFAFCKSHNKAIEINAWPQRLDLPDTLVREAVKQGIKLVIDTDSHAVEHMSLMEYGVSVARRGWATTDDILNAMEYNEVDTWFKK